jgi:hypothetical protein
MKPFLATRGWYALLPLPLLLGFLVVSGEPGNGQAWLVTIFGTLGMYALLWLLRGMARTRVGDVGQGVRCQNGHLVPDDTRICDRCGAPIPGASSR